LSVWNKVKAVTIVFVLVIGFCIPPAGTDQAAARTTPDDYGFTIHADKVVGTLDLGGIIIGAPGVIIGELPIAFLQAKIYGLTLTKLVRTDHGKMVLTIKSNEMVRVNFMNVRVTGLDVGGICLDGIPLIEQCLRDVTLTAKNLTTNNLEIPNMSVETSFDPKDVSQVQSLANSLSKQDLEKELEKLILALYEAGDGKNGNEIEAFKEALKDIPKLQEQSDQMDKWINEAEQQRKQAENQAVSLEKALNQAKELLGNPDELKVKVENLYKQQKDLNIQTEGFTITLQKADELLQEVVGSLEAKQKAVKSVSEELKKLKLGARSDIGKKVEETKEKLNVIEEKVYKNNEQLDKLKNEKQKLSERINMIDNSIEELKQIIDKQGEVTEEEVLPEKPNTGSGSTNTSNENSEGTTENASHKDLLRSDMEELLQQINETNETLSNFIQDLQDDINNPIKETLENPLEQNDLEELKRIIDNARKDKNFKNKLSHLNQIEETVFGYKSSLDDLTNQMEQLKQNNQLNDVQMDIREMEDKINHGKDIRQQMKARIDDIRKTTEDVFDHAKQRLEEQKEMTVEPLLQLFEEVLVGVAELLQDVSVENEKYKKLEW
jgi:chromosome segregation ATPase